jgi:double-stranded uracil-DNA glycosylase
VLVQGKLCAVVLVRSFPPIADAHARVLLLGSMPGAESLRQARYYAHPHNAFWPILGELFGFAPTAVYEVRTEALRRRGVALWDVLQSCERDGSLDSDIELDSIVVNDFGRFYAQHPRIEAVFCNGGAAFASYRRRVMPSLRGEAARLPVVQLPSTSPAHATLSRTAKLAAWRVVANVLSARASPSLAAEGAR